MERKKRRGILGLLEAIDFLDNTTPISEATVGGGYPDNGTGIATDDDVPTGNIVYGEKYKRDKYFNKLTSYKDIWKIDLSDWNWSKFENCLGMEDTDSYSDTLDSMEDLFPEEVWKNVWKRMKNVPDAEVQKGYRNSLEFQKDVKNQLGKDNQPHVDIDVDKGGSFKDSKIKKESLVNKIDNIIL